MKRFFAFLAGIALTSSLSGCVIVPLPHVTHASPEVVGKVVDSETGDPVPQAAVRLADRPSVVTSSKADGTFVLPHSWNFHLLWWATYDGINVHFPDGMRPSGDISISHAGYRTYEFKVQEVKTKPQRTDWPWWPDQIIIPDDLALEHISK